MCKQNTGVQRLPKRESCAANRERFEDHVSKSHVSKSHVAVAVSARISFCVGLGFRVKAVASTPTLTEDGSATLFSAAYGQTFHSKRGALTEARHVFLEGSGIAARLHAGARAKVLEVGFGTGLNFFVSAEAALKTGAALAYTALERDLLPAATVEALGYDTHLEPNLIQAYLTFRNTLPQNVPGGTYLWNFEEVRLALRVGEALAQTFMEDTYDAVYQDAFSPDANPELWTESYLGSLIGSLKPGGVLTTYSVKGAVRRRLQDLARDLLVEKRPGPPGGKREMLWVCKTDRAGVT